MEEEGKGCTECNCKSYEGTAGGKCGGDDGNGGVCPHPKSSHTKKID